MEVKTGVKGRTLGVKVYPLSEVRVDYMACAFAETEAECYVICTEGVGWEVPGKGFVTNDYDPDSHRYTYEELKSLTTGDEVDLADWIRTFGQRLESNFSQWYRKLGGEGASHGG